MLFVSHKNNKAMKKFKIQNIFKNAYIFINI